MLDKPHYSKLLGGGICVSSFYQPILFDYKNNGPESHCFLKF